MSLNSTDACKASGDSCVIENDKNISESTNTSENSNKTVSESVEEKAVKNDNLQSNDEYLSKMHILEQELQKAINEKGDYQKKFEETEKKLVNLQASYNAITTESGNEIGHHIEMEDLKNKLTQAQLQLSDRSRMVVNQENQINALTKQVSSLKEVVQITKDLLNIRNMEVKHLQADVDTMETRISAERDRHNMMLNKMNSAVRLNEDLKKEYETQLRLFQDLRGQYEKKVTLLSEENKALETAAQSLQ